jgi:hypothetical protein
MRAGLEERLYVSWVQALKKLWWMEASNFISHCRQVESWNDRAGSAQDNRAALDAASKVLVEFSPRNSYYLGIFGPEPLGVGLVDKLNASGSFYSGCRCLRIEPDAGAGFHAHAPSAQFNGFSSL